MVVLALTTSACGTMDHGGVPGPGERRAGTFKPYTINGVTYYPMLSARGYTEKGVASWYGPQFHGRSTANGERYDMYGITAAHPTLPLPTLARVTNLVNGKQVLVRVNDRGPFHKNRLIDLSYGAARELEVTGMGTAPVRVDVLEEDNPLGSETYASVAPAEGGEEAEGAVVARRGQAHPAPHPVAPPPGRAPKLFVQVGAFQHFGNAERLASRVGNLGKAYIQTTALENRTIYRVRLGPMNTVESADQMVEQLASLGIDEGRIVVE